jgi:2-phospho-L-lactate guanylyltransferase
MSVWAVVPIKPLNRAKSRLAGVLSPEQRERLALGMLLHNLHVLGQTSLIAGTLVISRDMKALAAAREVPNVQTLQETGTPELNNALQRACRMLISWDAAATLILPADIPLVCREDVESMVELGRYANTIVIAPDRRRDGTNAIFTRPPDLIDFGFGSGSFDRHIKSAHLVGADVRTYNSTRLELDIDAPEDLALYERLARHYGLTPIDYLGEASPGSLELTQE